MRVLMTGLSARAAAESAARAGFAVTALDAFADLDQHPSVRMLPAPPSFTAHRAARAALDTRYDAAVYLAGFENHPVAVGRLASGGALWGNAPDVLRQVRDPWLLTRTLQRRGFAAPKVIVGSRGPIDEASSLTWLVKPLASGGGHGVWPCAPGTGRPRGCYLQERVEGTPGSVVFVAAGGRAVPFGVSRQLVGERAFGISGYRYCGNILAADGDPPFDEATVEAARAIARVVAAEFGLVGVNGIDFVARDGAVHVTEVNPRWTGSMELVERAYGWSVFGAHAAACRAGELPDVDLLRVQRTSPAVGKAVVFAPRDIRVGDTRAWVGDPDIRDIPHPDQSIAAGRPVCTVFASGADAAACHAALVRRAEWVRLQLGLPHPTSARPIGRRPVRQ
jgi:predicted ATP-grasp superfamily ATP-dependent carboligase